MKKWFLFLLLGFYYLTGSLSYAGANFCEDLLADPTSAVVAEPNSSASKNLQKFEQIFTRSRGIQSYKIAFGSKFSEVLSQVMMGGHWLDSGAGDAIAVRQVLSETGASKMKATAISLESQAESEGNLKVLKGRYIETIPSSEIAKAQLITDFFGPLAYSGQPDLILKKYFEALAQDGQIFIFLGIGHENYGTANRIVTKDGRYLTLVDWIRQIPGIKAEIQVDRLDDDGTIVEKWNLRLSRDERYPLEIPSVELKEFSEGAPPKMFFKEIGSSSSKLQLQLAELKKKMIENIKFRNQNMTFTDFMNAFRSGEVSHPLVSAIKKLSARQVWANISDFSVDPKKEIRNKAFDASKTDVFWGPAQKWIRFRIHSISTEKFLYSPIRSSVSVEGVKNLALITDFDGDFVSSLQPDRILQRYLDSIIDEGAIFLYLGGEESGFGSTSEVIKPSGEKVTLRHWLENLPGINVKFYRGGYAYTGGEWTFVRVNKVSQKVSVPHLSFVGSDPQVGNEATKLVFEEQ